MPKNVLVVNAEGPETRVGVVEGGTLAEYYLERKRDRGIVGNIYIGKVTRVLPGMQAAFVDLGPTVERAAFLYVADILGSAEGKKMFSGSADDTADLAPEGTAARLARSRRKASNRKIEDLIKANQKVLVQIVKDPIGPKGARVTGYLSLPGRYSVFMPAVDHIGVSRRISTDAERKRLKTIVDDVRPKGTGFIVRTAADGCDEDELRDDVAFLVKLWGEVGRREKGMKKGGAGLLYADLDLVLRCIRDLLHEDTSEIVIDDEEQYERALKFTTAFLPRYASRIKHYQGRSPIFDSYGIEAELRGAMGRRVPLQSGGSLVIDQGEALTAIDVNTGSFIGKGGSSLEDTVTANNMEACKEVARQLRLRNIGGIIVIDFVDMDKEGNRKKVWDAFNKALSADRSRCNVTKISELGLVEMTRKRTRESLSQLLTEHCPSCDGAGVVKSTTTVANEVLREVRRLGNTAPTDVIEVECAPRVADLLRKYEREYIDELEKKFQKAVDIKGIGSFKPDQYKVAGKGTKGQEQVVKAQSKRRRGGRKKTDKDASGADGEKKKPARKRGGRGRKKAADKPSAEA